MRQAIPFTVALLLGACAATTSPEKAAPGPAVDPLAATLAQRDVELLTTYLEGTWETVPQPAEYGDSTPMRLRIARLWLERSGEYWLYAEYVAPDNEARVLRQRIFRFRREGARVEGMLYALPGDPAHYLGEWRKDRPFAGVNPASLKEIPGCRTLWVRQLESLFAAGGVGAACRGDRPEVVNEHSDFYLASSSTCTWIQGLDASGKRVEGPSGPSEFRKIAVKPR